MDRPGQLTHAFRAAPPSAKPPLLAESTRDGRAETGGLDEARKLINALAGLITAGAPEISDMHARSLRDGLRSVQLAFREASVIPDPIGKGPGEKWTGPVN